MSDSALRGFLFTIFLSLGMAALKLLGVHHWSWFVVLSPIWLSWAGIGVIYLWLLIVGESEADYRGGWRWVRKPSGKEPRGRQ